MLIAYEMEEEAYSAVPDIGHLIYFFRGQRVMLDSDLARLYGVTTKALNQGVRRNIERFPSDFMLQLNENEGEFLRSQIVTSKFSNEKRGGRRYLPMAFTEQGVAMLSSVLKSRQAVQVNIEIMRAFVRLKRLLDTNQELANKIAQLEGKYDTQFRAVFDAIREIMAPTGPLPTGPLKKRRIGI